MNKQTRRRLRQTARAARRSISLEYQQYAAQRACDFLQTDSVFLRSRHIASYTAFEGELSPAKIAQTAENLGKTNYLPLISDYIRPWEKTRLLFQPCNPSSDGLEPNRYGIPEPRYAPQLNMAPAMLDLVIMPLVAFDSQFNRLGMGKGYYDRTFGENLRWRRPYLLGLAYASQQLAQLDATELDVPLDGVLTEEGITWRKKVLLGGKWLESYR